MAINYEALRPIVKRVVSSVHASFPQHHDRDDTESTLWVWILENKNTVGDLVRNNKRWESNLYHLMTRAANGFLKKEDQASYGYSEDDVFNYPVELVRELLSNVFNYQDWQSFGVKGDGQPRQKVQANQTGDVLAMYADIKVAFEKIDWDQQQILLWTYRDTWTAEMIASELDITMEAAKKRVTRAVKAVQRRLGGKPYSDMRQGFSGRRAPSGTAESLAQTERDWNG